LLPFTEQHTNLFFGRERDIAGFVERLRLAPVLPVVGPSGAGKSSFVRAGVIPRLLEQDRWLIVRIRPGSQPFQALAGRLLTLQEGRGISNASGDLSTPIPEEPDLVDSLASDLREHPGRLSLSLRALAEKRAVRVLLFIDQFEELFTLCPQADLRVRFLNSVCSAADDVEEPVRVVFTVRDDFLGQLATSPTVREALRNLMVLERPKIDTLVSMIEGPAHAAAYRFDDGAMVREMAEAVVDEPAGLPLLSFAADKLWELRDSEKKLLLRSAYEKIGGVEGALVSHADGVLDGFASKQVSVARSLLLRMVTPQRTRRVISRQEALSGLPSGADEILTRLVDARLVSQRKAAANLDVQTQLELAHESLAIRWPTLVSWQDEDREELAFIADLKHASSKWENRGREEEVLWQGEELDDALRNRSRFSASIPESAAAFLDAAHRRKTRRARRRRTAVIGAFGAISLVAALLAVLSGRLSTEKRRAEEQRNEALLEDALSTLRQGDVLSARAKLRAAFEQHDSVAGRALWWQVARHPQIWRKNLNVAPRTVAFSPSGDVVAAGGDDGSLHLLDAVTGVNSILRGHSDTLQGIVYSHDGSTLATCGNDEKVLLWNLKGQPQSKVLSGADDVAALAFLPNDLNLLTGGSDGRLRRWDAQTGNELGVPFHGPHAIRSVAVAHDGSLAIVGDEGGQIHVVALEAVDKPHTLTPDHGAIQAVALSPDGKLLAFSAADGMVHVHDTTSWERMSSIGGHSDRVLDIHFSHSSELLATASFDGTIGVSEPLTGRRLATITDHESYVYAVRFSPDARSLVSVSYDRSVRLWRVNMADSRAPVRGHSGIVGAIAFSPDGAQCAPGTQRRSLGSRRQPQW
jgi:WD40 repeat protein